MENFVVSARKYRPQSFESVVGQSHVTTTLRNAILNNQLAHAFLFCGPRGVGKTTCARILAKTINCVNSRDGEPCNECPSCHSFNEGTSLNIHELDGASNNLVEDMRALIEQTRYPPQSGKFKVYIIDEVHMLTANAFNAFLKTLEEPPPYVIFILATTEKQKILPTILSRCQVFDFRRITVQDTVHHLREICLKEHTEAEEDALHLIAVKSEGCLRDSLSILDKIASFTNGHITYRNTLEHLEVLDYDYFFQVMEAIAAQDAARLLLIFDEVLQKGFEGDNFLDGLSAFIRDLLVSGDERVVHLLEVSPGLENRYKQAARNSDPALLVSALQILNEASLNYRQARNKRIHIEMTLLRLAYLSQAIRLISDEQTGEVSQKKGAESSPPKQLRRPFARPARPSERKSSRPVADAHTPSSPPREKTGSPLHPEPEQKTILAVPAPGPAEGSKRLTGLKGMKDALVKDQSGVVPETASPLSQDILEEKWIQFTTDFRAAHPASVSAFLESARLSVSGEDRIEISCTHIVQFRFIEEEKLSISEFLKKQFHRPGLVLSLVVHEDPSLKETAPEPLSPREQYLRMAEKYPLVRELRDQLNLDIEG
ncbi:MAG TPA: DNA polymerase III subunit gamma/tau [Chitinophagaceae bacterium]|nr:DNA polymerase III subunit gamma/tau [Chitinophagaceae bacterium]